MNEHFWWYVARSTGLVAWALATASVLWGLFLSTRALGKRLTAPWLLDLHRYLGGLTIALVGLHMGALVADSYTHFDVAGLLVPMASEWQPGPVAWGIAAFYLLVAVQLSSIWMRKIPKKVWRAIHLSSYLVFVAGTVHGVAAGTDMANPAAQWGALAGVLSLTFFLVYRLLAPKRRGRELRVVSRRPAMPQPAEAA